MGGTGINGWEAMVLLLVVLLVVGPEKLPEIAGQLGLSRHTVADYVKQIYRKLNVSSRAEAALEAARRGLVRP